MDMYARIAVAALVVSQLIVTGDADACAPAPPEGYSVAIAEEEALIVWDETKKTEHFVRRAVFDTKASDFGFLVPTPTQPELAEASDDVFTRLGKAIEPITRYETLRDVGVGCWTLMPLLRGAAPKAAVEATAAAPPPVRVLDEKRVAGLDAVVLEADSAGALGEWLKEHGYPFRPELTTWVEPYVAGAWKITAFKFARTSAAGAPAEVGSRAVRMSFRAERPFFPYREPGDGVAQAARSLRVFLVGSARMVGTLGAGKTPWDATVDYAGTADRLPELLKGALPPGAVPPEGWLTAYLDRSTVRAAHDVYFAPTPGGPPVIPPIHVVTHRETMTLPLEPVVLLAPVAYWVIRRRRRRALQDGGIPPTKPSA